MIEAGRFIDLADDVFVVENETIINFTTNPPVLKKVPWIKKRETGAKPGDYAAIKSLVVLGDHVLLGGYEYESISENSISQNPMSLVATRDLENPKRPLFTGFANDLNNERKFLGVIDGCVVCYYDYNLYVQVPQQNNSLDTIVFRKIEEIPKPAGFSWGGGDVIPLPGDKEKFGLVYGKKLYQINNQSKKFEEVCEFSIQIKLFAKTTDGRVFCSSGSSEFIELVWENNNNNNNNNENKTENNNNNNNNNNENKTENNNNNNNNNNNKLVSVRHLPWLDNVSHIAPVGEHGVAVTVGSGTYTCLVYTPAPAGANQLDGVVRYLPPFPGSSTKILWSKTQQVLGAFNFYQSSYSGNISKSDLLSLPSKLVGDCYDAKALLKDVAFSLYVPTTEDLVGLQVETRLTDYEKASCLKTIYNFVEPNDFNNYRIIAGWQLNNNPSLNDLKYPNRYVDLEKFEDLADYIGAPIFAPYEYSSTGKRVETGLIAGFHANKRSSKAISVLTANKGMSGSRTISAKAKWVAVVAYCPFPRASEEKKTIKANFASSGNSFEVVSNKIRVSDPSYDPETAVRCGATLPFARNGNWNFTYKELGGRIAQLIAVHEDFAKEEISVDYTIPLGTFDDTEQDNAEREDVNLGEFNAVKLKTKQNWNYVADRGIGVDSGRAGVYDFSRYHDDSVFAPKEEPEKVGWEKHFTFDWRESLWQETVDDFDSRYPVAFPYGVVSPAGYGDGCYPCLFRAIPKDNNDNNNNDNNNIEIVAVKVIFIEKEDEEQ